LDNPSIDYIKKKRIIDQVLGPSTRQGSEFVYPSLCCGHHKPKLSINFQKGVYKCWVCDYRGKSLKRLVRRWGNFSHISQWRQFDKDPIDADLKDIFTSLGEDRQIIDLPDDFIPLSRPQRPMDNKAHHYLRNRGLSKEDILMWRIGYCPTGHYANRIIVPSFSEQGDCNYYVARTYEKKRWPPYLNGPGSKDIIFNELMIDWDSEVVLVEGVFDAIAVGNNAIPLLGSTLRDDSELFSRIVSEDASVVIALDHDAYDKSLRIAKKLLSYDIEVRFVDTSGYKDVAEMSKPVLSQRLKEAPFLNTDGYLERKAKAI